MEKNTLEEEDEGINCSFVFRERKNEKNTQEREWKIETLWERKRVRKKEICYALIAHGDGGTKRGKLIQLLSLARTKERE